MIEAGAKCGIIRLDEETLGFSFETEQGKWSWRSGWQPTIVCEDKRFLFKDAGVIRHEVVKSGVGEGIRSYYAEFESDGIKTGYAFETLVWIEYATGDVFCEWIPACEDGLNVKAVFWPGEMEFTCKTEQWYTLLNDQQGLLIPNNWDIKLGHIAFNGMFCTAGAYMPWFAQVREREGYIAICLTPWNAGYQSEHPAGGPYTHVGVRLESSLGRMDYRRIVRYTFLADCDYNDICKVYRTFVREQGRLVTLREKAAKTPSVDRLIGSAFVHKGIKTCVQPDSDFFDSAEPEKNNSLTMFEVRKQEMEELHRLGVKKLYLHLDGWAEPGYDNMHPDYMPACEAAGGWEGMKALTDGIQELGYLFGIHDQYRDYYRAAPSFHEDYACRLTDGSIPQHKRWAGGPQSYLCATQAPYYVKRNFSTLKGHGIHLDGAYLDVFTCNEGDECDNPRHRMTRRECYEYRGRCFEYLLSQGILPSSEEVSDWSIPHLVFCHYAPYDFMMRKPGTPKQGIPVPLFNLVYHDCVVIPWMMEQVSDQEDYMLYALLNGGAPYLIRDGAYPNTDGSFDGGQGFTMEEMIRRCDVVCQLHEKVAKCELVRHEIIDGDWRRQKTVFADGTMVYVDFSHGSYQIGYGEQRITG